MAFFPVPDTDWNVVTTIRLIFAASWIGFKATTMPMVEQFGLAIMPLCAAMACGFTSGTTRGTFGSMRNGLELSITTAPDAAAAGADSRPGAAPAENSGISTPLKESFGSG